jgi:hypothetical protein
MLNAPQFTVKYIVMLNKTDTYHDLIAFLQASFKGFFESFYDHTHPLRRQSESG